MAATKAQRTERGRKNYGRNKTRGDSGEKAVRDALKRQGYTVTQSDSGRGFADLTARKDGKMKRIQVKNITSRRFLTASAARKRVKGAPFNIKRIPKDGEVWVFDKDGRRYVFGEKRK
ncbi:hypothetical protein ABH15_10010 [Methanoculleus taiwanensis]|uniref:PD(D/E)XK endonuclease domain-containing protein n=1 Tax=Methanoculleus taiwanensis TaxID=1550565 RepID=A0A498H0F7_9EURY|nr:group I intron-associated PD-(D/E)XK endonuclease [Methanoculleus taiwanensis]RXE56409.1 hypothetical protein ABH15_10010 [Methanoculleus taiwanensis]